MPARPLADALDKGTVILDGGLSNQLTDQGQDLSGGLWSARLLADDPGQLMAAHIAYLRAGARVLISASYQASSDGFARSGVGAARTADLLRRSVKLARLASDREGIPAWVAASAGPYGATLADGSEYRGRYGLSVRELERFHRPRIEALAEAAPDVLALETVPDIDEAQALLRASAVTGVPAWLSYTIKGDATRAGQPLTDAFAVAAGNEQVIAVGVNCCHPADAGPAVEIAARVTGKPVVVYPNSGEDWDVRARGWSGRSLFDPSAARAWRDAGAALIGGCCRVGPGEIEALAGAVRHGQRLRPQRHANLLCLCRHAGRRRHARQLQELQQCVAPSLLRWPRVEPAEALVGRVQHGREDRVIRDEPGALEVGRWLIAACQHPPVLVQDACRRPRHDQPERLGHHQPLHVQHVASPYLVRFDLSAP
jgi:homocysteine S-methyltransferase